jgi:hypothetical protein
MRRPRQTPSLLAALSLLAFGLVSAGARADEPQKGSDSGVAPSAPSRHLPGPRTRKGRLPSKRDAKKSSGDGDRSAPHEAPEESPRDTPAPPAPPDESEKSLA